MLEVSGRRSDEDAEFVSGDSSKAINWDYGMSSNVGYHEISLAHPTIFSESSEQANWGTWFLATAAGDGVRRPLSNTELRNNS